MELAKHWGMILERTFENKITCSDIHSWNLEGGYLIHYVPTDQGLKKVVEEISSCADDDDNSAAHLDVGKMYYSIMVIASGLVPSVTFSKR